MTNCTVIGAGAWGTALADLLARNGHRACLWARESDVVSGVNELHENKRFLDGFRLHDSLVATEDMAAALDGAELVVYAAPSHVLRRVVRAGAAEVPAACVVAVATKGIEEGSLAVMTEVVSSELRGQAVVALSGPSFAAEVAKRQPTAVVAASQSAAAALVVQRAVSGDEFRVYTHGDVLGVELGGALKNVMAVAAGMVEGLGLGYNSRAALITRGLAEMTRLGTALGASPATFAGLAGIGDLVLTCTGGLSRNRAVGLEIGQGKSLAQAVEGKETVAEGVVTARSAHALAQRTGIEMPIVAAVHGILFDGRPAREAIGELMRRELRPEQDG